MTKYLVNFIAAVGKTIEVEADSPQEAEELAQEQVEDISLCHQCADQCGDSYLCLQLDPNAPTEEAPA